MSRKKYSRIAHTEIDFYEFCSEQRISVIVVRNKCRRKDVVINRMLIARHLRGKGHGYLSIGVVMHRHHTSIINLCNLKMREKKHKRYLRKIIG